MSEKPIVSRVFSSISYTPPRLLTESADEPAKADGKS